MLSTHLAELYEVEPRALVQAVKRNIERFPPDFIFQLSKVEFPEFEITNCDFKLGRSASGGSLRVHRTRGGHAIKRFKWQAGSTGQHRNHAGFCAATGVNYHA